MKINLLVAGSEGTNEAENIRHLLYTYQNEKHAENYLPYTADSSAKKYKVNGNDVELFVDNTIGRQNFQTVLSKSFFKRPDGAFMLVYSANDPQSFNDIETKWCPLIQWGTPLAPIILVCLKPAVHTTTVKPAPVIITQQQGISLANKIGAAAFIECDTRDSDQVKNVFEKYLYYAFVHHQQKMLVTPDDFVTRQPLSAAQLVPKLNLFNVSRMPQPPLLYTMSTEVDVTNAEVDKRDSALKAPKR